MIGTEFFLIFYVCRVRDFNFAKCQFILSYGLRCKVHMCVCVCVCVCVWPLSFATGNDTHALTTHPFLGRISPLLLCLKLYFKGFLVEMFR